MAVEEATAPTVTDPTTGSKTPVYIGGDPPIELSRESDAAARGDVVTTTTTTETPPAKKEEPAKEAPVEEEPLPAAAKKEAEDADPERDDKGRFVTKKRFNEVNERRRLAEEKLAEIEREKKAKEQGGEAKYDFDAKEQQYIELILDGKTAEAAKLRSEIRAAEQAQFEQVAVTKAEQTNRAMTVEQRIQAISAHYEKTVPQFDPESEHYSEEVLDDVNAFYTGYLQSKKFDNAADAFQAAINKALASNGIELPKAKDDPPPAAKETPAAPARTAAKRIDAIKQQPPNIARTGAGSADHGDANIRVAELSEQEFARLPEATRRRLRGDNV